MCYKNDINIIKDKRIAFERDLKYTEDGRLTKIKFDNSEISDLLNEFDKMIESNAETQKMRKDLIASQKPQCELCNNL